MKIFVTAMLTLSFLSKFALASEMTTKIKSLSCSGTAEGPGDPRDVMKLSQQDDGNYTLSYASQVKEKNPTLKTLSRSLTCNFSTQNLKIFACRSITEGGSVESLILTTQKLGSSTIHSFSSVSVQMVGADFAEDFPEGVLILKFMFVSNCKISE